MTEIALDDLKPLANWRDAPVGALLKARGSSDEFLFGMRCEMKIGAMPMSCFLVLAGESRGLLLEGNIQDAAMNVSSRLEIVVKDPFPVQLTHQHYSLRGIVCASAPSSGFLFVRAMLQSQKRTYVTLRDPRGTPTGTVFDQNPDDVWILGLTDVSDKIALDVAGPMKIQPPAGADPGV